MTLVGRMAGTVTKCVPLAYCLSMMATPSAGIERWKYFGDDSSTGSAGGSYNVLQFGSAHTAGINAVFADGSVHSISYGIDVSILTAWARAMEMPSMRPIGWMVSIDVIGVLALQNCRRQQSTSCGLHISQ